MAVKIFKKASLRTSPWCCTSVYTATDYFVRFFLSRDEKVSRRIYFVYFITHPKRFFDRWIFVKVNRKSEKGNSSLGKNSRVIFEEIGIKFSPDWFWKCISKVERFLISRSFGKFSRLVSTEPRLEYCDKSLWAKVKVKLIEKKTFPPPLFYRLFIEFNWKESGFSNGNDRIVCIKEIFKKFFRDSIRCKIFPFVFIHLYQFQW